jgi:hypothetical protein
MSNHEHDSFDVHALRRSLRLWRLAAVMLGCALFAAVGVGMAQDEAPIIVGFGVSDQPSGRIDDSFYRLLSDGTIEQLDTTRPTPEWGPAPGLQRIRN